jgi:hypothetical protein
MSYNIVMSTADGYGGGRGVDTRDMPFDEHRRQRCPITSPVSRSSR